MMRQNEARRRTPVLVLLDVRPGSHDQRRRSTAVEACASIVTAIERSARPVEVMLSTGQMIGTPGRRHLGTVMDELAVVEPHGPERIAASDSRHRSGALFAIMGRSQSTGPRPPSVCSSATAVSSPWWSACRAGRPCRCARAASGGR